MKNIYWANCSTQPGSVHRLACDDFLESLAEHSLVQLNSEATREKSILDLYFTNRPSLAHHIAVPGISDHDCAILTDTYLSPVINNTTVWQVCAWSQANWAKICSQVQAFATDFLAEYLSCSVDQNWQWIEDCPNKPMTECIPSHKAATRKQGKSEGFESCDWPIVRKRPIWLKIGDALYRVTLKFDGWPWKTIGHPSFAVSSFVQHFIAIGEFKLELQSRNGQFGSNSTIFRAVWPWNLTDDLEKR